MAISMGGGDDSVMSEINTTPLVDVMLVMLIIFLITIPAVLESIEVQMPDLAFEPTVTKPENVLLTVRGTPGDNNTCQVFWGQTPINSSVLLEQGREKLEKLIRDLGGMQNVTEENLPEVHIRGDINTPYKCIGGVIYTMQYAGFQKIGFISEPAPGSATLGRL
ncbi:MAG: biopolymer transporter ExbD [Sphingopyxis sp.]